MCILGKNGRSSIVFLKNSRKTINFFRQFLLSLQKIDYLSHLLKNYFRMLGTQQYFVSLFIVFQICKNNINSKINNR